jgi:hypothetical protein
MSSAAQLAAENLTDSLAAGAIAKLDLFRELMPDVSVTSFADAFHTSEVLRLQDQLTSKVVLFKDLVPDVSSAFRLSELARLQNQLTSSVRLAVDSEAAGLAQIASSAARLAIPSSAVNSAVALARFESSLAAEVTVAARFDEILKGSVRAAETFADALQPTRMELLSDAIRRVQGASLLEDRRYLEVFDQTAAFANAIAEPVRLAREQLEAAASFSRFALPEFSSLAECGRLFDAAGLALPHWPRPPFLKLAQHRRTIRARIAAIEEPVHVREAKTLVHKHEIVLREVIDAAMSAWYGEDWARQRLPLCGCGALLGKWRKRGGFVLEHADYFHYRKIMTHAEHFENVFAAAVDDPDELGRLLDRAGALRGASHHARPFTPEDLRELRSVWLMLESAMSAMLGFQAGMKPFE